jgi:hypothetical protein
MLRTDCFGDMIIQSVNNPIINLSTEQYGSVSHIIKSIEMLNTTDMLSSSIQLAIQHTLSSILYILHDAIPKHSVKSKFAQDRQSEILQEFFKLVIQNYKKRA